MKKSARKPVLTMVYSLVADTKTRNKRKLGNTFVRFIAGE